jgi:tetratricopeptide (TPR) repeat protein
MTGQRLNTIYLTEQEVERIRNTVKEKVKKCSELEGRAREPRDKQSSIGQAKNASLMADMGGAQEDALPALGVGSFYPPSTFTLHDLQPMKLTELQMNTHYRGRRLTVKRISPVVTLTARSWTIVQDENDEEVERLELCLHSLRYGEDVLESGSVFVIKEPYFTLGDDGEATLLINHPSDLVICEEESASIKSASIKSASIKSASLASKETNGGSKDAATVENAAKTLKTQGNAALKEGDLPLALAKYTVALKIASQDVPDIDSTLAQDISRNRAYVNLLLNRLDGAKMDAKASIIDKEDERSKELDAKAYLRAGNAAYSQGKYNEAKSFCDEQQKLAPGSKDASISLRRIEKRLREQEKGLYNFKNIQTALSRNSPNADAASFTRNTLVKDSPGKGRGLFAACDIPAGDLVMCEKAFCVVWGHQREALTAITYDLRDDRIRISPVGLSRAVVQKLLNNPSEIEKVMNLFGDYSGDGKDVFQTEDGPVVDTFRVHDIVSRNAFGAGNQYGEEDAKRASTGLWVRAAYANHSCFPNVKKECMGDLMLLRATQAIKAGTELFHSYDESSDYDTRQAALMATWGFECNCGLCQVQKSEDPAVRKKRAKLASDADAFVERSRWVDAKRLTISKAKALAKAIDDTYDSQKYDGLPRVAAENIQKWLALAAPRR